MLHLLLLALGCSCAWPAPLELLLAEPLRSIPFVHVLLRDGQLLQEDASNEHARWFMQLTDVPHIMHTYDEHQPLEMASGLVDPDVRDSFALVISVAQLISSSGAASSADRAGVYFYIVADIVDSLSRAQRLALEQSCRRLWTQHRVFNRYIIVEADIWIYDPFARSDQPEWSPSYNEQGNVNAYDDAFGRLVPYLGGEPLSIQLFHDMHGYPLRVQIFKSVYARPEVDERTGLLSSITGVDWQVAQMISELLNFTMLLQQPDKNYFG